MDLISDLGNDVALEFLIERGNSQKMDPGEIIELIGRIRTALQPISVSRRSRFAAKEDILNKNRTTFLRQGHVLPPK